MFTFIKKSREERLAWEDMLNDLPVVLEDAERFRAAIGEMDARNSKDPTLLPVGGHEIPAEYWYGQCRYNWVLKLNPQASEALLLAARAQHIGRWEVPRSSYPEGKAGYHRWRNFLKSFHADEAGKILRQVGYAEEVCERVGQIIRKENLADDAEVQTAEDALCLVFLEYQYDAFQEGHPEEKIISILRKTWVKMSPAGQQAALNLPFGGRAAECLRVALG